MSNITDNPKIQVLKAGCSGVFTNYIYKAIPLAFDESMSYYETLAGLRAYLKDVILPTVNGNAEAVAELQELYIQLNDYVTNYFDNLDVQEEINNKLDEMVEDGTLESILLNYTQIAKVFDTYSDMMLDTSTYVNGMKLKTLGYHYINDGGGADYVVTSTQSETHYQETIGLNKYIELIVNDDITPEVFGSYGDGTQDDTQAIKKCLIYGNNIKLTKIYKVTENLGNIANKKIFGNGTIYSYVEEKLFTKIDNSLIDNLTFENKVATVDENNLVIGDFADELNISTISNCTIKNYSSFIRYIHYVSNVKNNKIFYLKKIFADIITDSYISNNYINASKLALVSSIMVRSSINNSSFNNNFVDYWRHCFRLKSGNRSSQIIGNTFDDCYTVFQDYVQQLTIQGNTFSNIKYVAANWQNATIPEDILNSDWSIFKFDKTTETTTGNTSMALADVCFVGNLTRNCQNYITKINENAKNLFLYGKNIFDNNILFEVENLEKDVKFTVTQTAYDNKQVGDPYFDFWEGQKYTTLPAPNIISSSGIVSYNNMRCFLDTNGTITEHININGTWKQYSLT